MAESYSPKAMEKWDLDWDNVKKIRPDIIYYSASQQGRFGPHRMFAGYGMMALPMMMNISQEDAHHRMRTLAMDTPYTWASEEYDKDNKDAKLTAVTRYRYLITAEASNQTEDQSQWLKDLVEEIAKKFAGK